MPTVRNYFARLDKEMTLGALYALYEDQIDNARGYNDAWDEILTITPSENTKNMRVELNVPDRDPEFPEDWPYVDVYGVDPNAPYDEHMDRSGEDIHWALEFNPWEDWLSYEVRVTDKARESGICSNDYEVLAHILYEMTFTGYSQAAVKAERDELQSRSDEVEQWIKEGTIHEHTIPADELFRRLDALTGGDDDDETGQD